MTRPTTATTTAAEAACLGCDWHTASAGALGHAAQHHDRTGHTISVTLERHIIYGDPTAPPPGQTTLAELA